MLGVRNKKFVNKKYILSTKKRGNYIGQVYAAKLFVYFGNGKYILVLTKLFEPEKNILVLAQIWFGRIEGPGS